MEFRQLKTFRAVCQNLSFTKTAEQLYMAQSSVSAQIRSLETELGVKLFDRIGRSIALTDAGRKLYDYACRLEGITEEIKSEVGGDKYLKGTLTIRMPETLASVYMPRVIERYIEDYPDVRLEFINCSDLQLARELNSGRIDLAFLMSDLVKLKDVKVTFLKSEKLVMVAAPEHILATKIRVTLQDLNEETILFPRTD